MSAPTINMHNISLVRGAKSSPSERTHDKKAYISYPKPIKSKPNGRTHSKYA